jgi:hypothetical protein
MRWRAGVDFDRRIAEVKAEQEIKRTTAAQLGGFQDAKELRAAKFLAARWFGSGVGLLQFDQSRPGIAQIGYYVGPKTKYDGIARKRVIAFEGATVAELEEQYRLWRERRT